VLADAGQMLAEMLEMLAQMLGPLRCWLLLAIAA
jgi:hypothetical protein